MKKVLFLIVLVLFSCKSDTDFDKPENLIPKDQMIDILVDLHLSVSAMNTNNLKNKKSNRYIFLVYDKYGIDSLRFKESNRYYASKVDEYFQMFKEVQKRLVKLSDKYEIRAKQDSIEKVKQDSVLKSHRKRFRPEPKKKRIKRIE